MLPTCAAQRYQLVLSRHKQSDEGRGSSPSRLGQIGTNAPHQPHQAPPSMLRARLQLLAMASDYACPETLGRVDGLSSVELPARAGGRTSEQRTSREPEME